jgi:hypothetical protein
MKMFCPSLNSTVKWYSSRCAAIVSLTCEGTCTFNTPVKEMLLQHSKSSKADGMEVVSSMLNLPAYLLGNLHFVVSQS